MRRLLACLILLLPVVVAAQSPPARTAPTERDFIAQWRAALRTSNTDWLRQLAGQMTASQLFDCLMTTQDDLIEEFRPEAFLLYRELRAKIGRPTGDIVALAATNPEWMAFFHRQGIDRDTQGGGALLAAIGLGADYVDALLKAGFKTELEWNDVLCNAIQARDCEVLARLLAVAPPSEKRSTFHATPLEEAVQKRLAGAIRLLDPSGAHQALVAEIEKELPPTKGSRFVGRWKGTDTQEKLAVLHLRDDGTATYYGNTAAWREEDRKVIVAFFMGVLGDKPGWNRPSRFAPRGDDPDALESQGLQPFTLRRMR